MEDLLGKIIMYDSEGPWLDFKEIQYSLENNPKKNELLKDISAMANYPGDQDKFIIIGVIESNGVAEKFRDVGQLIDESKYQQFVLSNIEPKINFEYKKFQYQNHQLAYFRIFNNVDRPYLFKKDVTGSALPDRVEFRAGDGFVRIGPSTKKMTRDDFERIYSQRYTKRDRKGDISIVPTIRDSRDEDLQQLGLRCIEIEIKNNSSKSIDLDVQMKIFKSDDLSIVSEHMLLRKMEEKRQELERRKNPYSIMIPSTIGFSFDVSIEDKDDFFLVTRDKRRGERTALSIAQHDNYPDVFCAEAIILTESEISIKGEIIARSDDFTGGTLVEQFTINYVP